MPTRTPYKHTLAVGANTWTNMPLALTEFLGQTVHRSRVDLTDADKVRLVARVNTAGAAAAVLFVQYSTDESSWQTLTSNQLSLAGTGTQATAWEAMPAGARGDVFVRLVGQSGNGTADPVVGSVMMEVR